MNSLNTLYSAPYNKSRPLFAFYRYAYWKLIRLFRLKNIPFRFWGDRVLRLCHDSPQSMWAMYNYLVDWEEFNLISRYTRSGDHVLDVGANIGLYSLWMSRFVGPAGKVHSFEPDPENFKKLGDHISRNGLETLFLSNKTALSDVDGILSFTTGLDKENHIATRNEPDTIQIIAERLDTYAARTGLTGIPYMKIDVEGFEYSVLKGAERLLAERRIQVIQLEINDTIRNSGSSVSHLLGLLERHGYVLCSYDVTAGRLLQLQYSPERENYFAVYDLQQANQKLASGS
jgi:FkbM family methyltransferase